MTAMALDNWLPPQFINICLVLFLSFLIGLEREEHKMGAEKFSFGGVRTFPLIGLIAYAIAFLSGDQLLPVVIGFAVVGAFLLLSYWHKLQTGGLAGVTSELSGLTTYLIGALVFHQEFWIAVTLAVVSLFLLELKLVLEGLTSKIAPQDIYTFSKFLLLSAVILPILPNAEFTQFQINPFKTWLVVVAVSAVSYGSYVLQRVTKGQGNIILAAILGGAYSSTVTTVVLARRSAREAQAHKFSGGILIASGMMYLRICALLGFFNRDLLMTLGPSFVAIGTTAAAAGWIWSRRADSNAQQNVQMGAESSNPLELRAALIFALLFLVMLMATHLAVTYLGNGGVYLLAAIMGVADVDHFIMGMTQTAGELTPVGVASAAVLIAAASNNVVKGFYAYFMGSRAAGGESLVLLWLLAAAGLMPLLWQHA
jgi:uncharacterized membrane protein (DUF4010 family)